METQQTAWVAGVDGCRAGWAVVLQQVASGAVRTRLVPSFDEVLALPEAPSIIGIDMVIGLPDQAAKGGRACDRAARALLGWPRSSSVFSPPVRAALGASSYQDALAINRASSEVTLGFSIEAYNLFPKLREVDAQMTPARQKRICEVHPELSFRAMNGGEAVVAGKRTAEGRAQRLALLAAQGFDEVDLALAAQRGVQRDDLVDAYAACWSARRIQGGRAVCLPDAPERDARGLRMEIWY